VGWLLKVAGALVTQDMEKAEVLDATFTSLFTSKSSLQQSKGLETESLEQGTHNPWWKKIRLQNTYANWTM